MDINMEYFKIFYFVAKYGSVTAAARELHISQPAVSQALKSFEASIGGDVFVRTSKGVSLTQEGKTLFHHVAKGYEHFENGVKQYEALKNLEGGIIRIGASDMTLRFFILPYLESFCEKHPQIKVSVTNAPTPKTLRNLTRGTIDFGVISTPIERQANIRMHAVKNIEDIFVVGEKFKELATTEQEYNILQTHHYICLAGETSSKQYVDSFLMEQGIRVTPEFELATSDMIVSFAKRGFGIASVVKDFAEEEIRRGGLFEIPFKKKMQPRQFAVVYDERQSMSMAAKELLGYMNVQV